MSVSCRGENVVGFNSLCKSIYINASGKMLEVCNLNDCKQLPSLSCYSNPYRRLFTNWAARGLNVFKKITS